MARGIVDHSIVDIDGQELQCISEFSIQKTYPRAAVKTMNRRRRPIGYTGGVPEYTGSMKSAFLQGALEFDFDSAVRNGTTHTVTYERARDGQRMQLVDVMFKSVSEGYSESGEMMADIEFEALDEQEAP